MHVNRTVVSKTSIIIENDTEERFGGRYEKRRRHNWRTSAYLPAHQQ